MSDKGSLLFASVRDLYAGKKLPKPQKLMKNSAAVNGGDYIGWLGLDGIPACTLDPAFPKIVTIKQTENSKNC